MENMYMIIYMVFGTNTVCCRPSQKQVGPCIQVGCLVLMLVAVHMMLHFLFSLMEIVKARGALTD